MSTSLKQLICKTLGVDEDELAVALSSCLLFFLILTGYYILRPLREEMGLAGGVDNLPYLFMINLVAMLAVTPIFGWVATRWSRRHFLPGIYLFFMLNMLTFFMLMRSLPPEHDILLGRIFYVWMSVYNMWTVSLFWAFMADGYGLDSSKRLFGIVATGGTAGAVLGASITSVLVDSLGRINLILVSAGFMLAAAALVHYLSRRFKRRLTAGEKTEARPPAEIRPAVQPTLTESWQGAIDFFRSPYLLAIGGYLFLYTLSSTFLYFEQAEIIESAVVGREARARIFANIDLWVNTLTLTMQIFFTGRLIRYLGVGRALMVLPIITVIGFAALGFAPTLAVLIVFQVLRRAGNYALSRPARETLYTIVSRDQRYKAKSFIDTFVYRGGDMLAAWSFKLLGAAGLSLGAIALVALPPAVLWAFLGRYLGRQQDKRARNRPTD